MKIALEVKFLNGTTQKAVAQFVDFIAFERAHNRSVAKFETELKLTDLAWMAWHVEKRNRRTTLEFDPWLETVEAVEVGEDAKIVPLESTQPTG